MYMLPCCVCIVTNSFAIESSEDINFETDVPVGFSGNVNGFKGGKKSIRSSAVTHSEKGEYHESIQQDTVPINEKYKESEKEEDYYSENGDEYSEDERQKKCVIVDENILFDMDNRIDMSISKLNELVRLLNKRRSGNAFSHEVSNQLEKLLKLHQDIVDKVDGYTQNVEENQTTMNEIQQETKWIIEHLGQFESTYNEPTPTQAILEVIQGSIENAYKEQIQSISKLIRELEEKNGKDAKNVIGNLINIIQGMRDSIDAVKNVVDEIQQKTSASSFDNNFSTVSQEISLEQNSDTSENADIKAILNMVNHINKKLRKQSLQNMVRSALFNVLCDGDFLKKIKGEIYDQAGLQELQNAVSDVVCGDNFWERMRSEMLGRPAENWSGDKDIKKKLGYLEENKQGLKKLGEGFSRMQQSHDEMSNNVAELKTSVNNMGESFIKNAEESNNSIRSINESINSVRGDMCKVTRRIGKMEQDITQMAELLNKQSEASKSIEQRIDKLGQCVNQMVELLNEQSEAVKNLNGIFGGVKVEFALPKKMKTRGNRGVESAGVHKEGDGSNV